MREKASGSERPSSVSSSKSASKAPVSEARSSTSGKAPRSAGPKRSLDSVASRAASHVRLPNSVLISPLWATQRIGWARGHEGNVLVEKRLCTTATWLAKAGCERSG